MSYTTKKEIFTVEVAVEVPISFSDEDLQRRLNWVRENITESCRNMQDCFVTMVFTDEGGNFVTFSGVGKGKPSDTTTKNIEKLLEVS